MEKFTPTPVEIKESILSLSPGSSHIYYVGTSGWLGHLPYLKMQEWFYSAEIMRDYVFVQKKLPNGFYQYIARRRGDPDGQKK